MFRRLHDAEQYDTETDEQHNRSYGNALCAENFRIELLRIFRTAANHQNVAEGQNSDSGKDDLIVFFAECERVRCCFATFFAGA